MRFSIKAGDLLVGLQKTSNTVDKSDSSLGTNGVLFDVYAGESSHLYLYSTDMLGETVVKLNATVEESGQAVIDPVYIQALLLHRNPDELVNFSLVKSKVEDKPTQIKIKIGKNISHLGYSQKGVETLIKRMKEIPFKTESSYQLEGKNYLSAIKKLSFCAAGEGNQTRFLLNGMSIKTEENSISFSATNGEICGRYTINNSEIKYKSSLIIPVRSFSSITKLIKDTLIKVINVVNKSYIKIGENVFFGTNLLSGKFPAIDQIFDGLDGYKTYQWVTINKEELKQIIDRMSVFDTKRRLQLEFTSELLKINVKGSDGLNINVSDELLLEWEDKESSNNIDFIATLNLDNVHNILSAVAGKTIKIGVHDFNKLSSKTRPVMFLEEDFIPAEKDKPEGKQIINSILLYALMMIKEN